MSQAKKANKILKSFKIFLASDLSGKVLNIVSHPALRNKMTITVFAETKNMLIYTVEEDRLNYKMISKHGTYETTIGENTLRFSGKFLYGTARTRRKRRIRRW